MSKKEKAFDACRDVLDKTAARIARRESIVRDIALSNGFEPETDGSDFLRECPHCRVRLRIRSCGFVTGEGCQATSIIHVEILAALRGLPS